MTRITKRETIERLDALIASGRGDEPLSDGSVCPLWALWPGREIPNRGWVRVFMRWADGIVPPAETLWQRRWRTLTARQCREALG